MSMQRTATPRQPRPKAAQPAAPNLPDAEFGSIVKHLTKRPGVTTARMFGAEGLKVNGKVFAMVVKGRLVVKLRATRAAELLASGQGEPFDPGHGRVMKEWVSLKPGSGGRWLKIAAEALDYVGAAATQAR